MSALKFYPLAVKEVRSETADCVSVSLAVPEQLSELFQFAPGQYLTFRTKMDELELRRSYSICSSPGQCELRVAIKEVEQGKFSSYANRDLKVGDVLEVMPPMGKFTPRTETPSRRYLAFAAGSGITPILSIIRHTLETVSGSEFTLIYGNKNRNSIIFREAIEALKNQYMQRVRIYHVLSREFMDVELFNGRIDGPKVAAFCDGLIDVKTIDEAFLRGPESMILSAREELVNQGMERKNIHLELFSSPDQPQRKHEQWAAAHQEHDGPVSKVSITLDGTTFTLNLPYNGTNILDAALAMGADLPYACKGGVCSTCRAKIIEGEVEMEVNYALEPDEIAKGYVLTCQSHPRTERVVVDFDAR